MKLTLLPLTLVTGVLIAAGVGVALLFGASNGGGGGGGDTSTLAGYFQTLNTLQTGLQTDYSAVEAKYPNAFSDKQQTLDYLDENAKTWTDAVDKLKTIEPPDAAVSAHDSLVKAVGDVGGAFATLRTSAESTADDPAALGAIATNVDRTAFDAYGSACTALQDLADQNSVAVTLAC
jgi:hypothetical protein